MSGATVTPTGVRDGDPAALAGLCAVRGPSVVAYCRHVAGEADAGAAAADAFARFRVAVVAAGDTASLNPEALLISATRTSAAARAGINAQGDCAEVPMLLATRAERTIGPADLERLESHLEQCWACRAPVARFKAAERAYRDPPEKTVDEVLSAQIVGALIAAVPSAPPPQLAPASVNGNAEQASEAEPEAAPAAPLDQPTEHFAAPEMAEPLPAEADADGEAEAAAAKSRRRRREPRSGGAGAGALLARLRPPARSRGPRERPAKAAKPLQARTIGAPRERPRRSRPALRLTVVLPIVLILLALIAALYVSGVVGGDDPASTPSVSAPTAAPHAELVVVPGAKDASADAVESAKARARGEDPTSAKKREQAKAEPDREARPRAPAASPPPAAASPPPAAPAVSANNPVNPPPAAPKRETEANDDKQLDAGSGATGAEQIPPAEDAADVPDLAPPPELPAP